MREAAAPARESPRPPVTDDHVLTISRPTSTSTPPRHHASPADQQESGWWIFIPGSGPGFVSLETGPRQRLVHTTAQAGLRDGLTPLQAARTCHLGPFADLPDAEPIVLNLHRAYADTTGHPFDLPQAFTDAITYNSGPLHTQV
ncbi:hypothetical protein ASE41_02535 [Streptomyces sp. Root264]|nr:hypothetical protein ASE41_02535 [Streptomyces sp. Root264]